MQFALNPLYTACIDGGLTGERGAGRGGATDTPRRLVRSQLTNVESGYFPRRRLTSAVYSDVNVQTKHAPFATMRLAAARTSDRTPFRATSCPIAAPPPFFGRFDERRSMASTVLDCGANSQSKVGQFTALFDPPPLPMLVSSPLAARSWVLRIRQASVRPSDRPIGTYSRSRSIHPWDRRRLHAPHASRRAPR